MIITAGTYKGRKIISPDERITRPTLSQVRMGVFNTLFSIMGDFSGKSFLDLFGGSGIMGLEALSRGFEKARVFEKNIKAAEIIKKNYSTLGLNADLFIGDSIKLLDKYVEFFNVIYVDPPYESGIYEKILPKLSADIIVVEHSDDISFEKFKVIKSRNYSGKRVSYLEKCK